MAGNVKLAQFKKIDIPVQAQREDRGYNACKEPLLKLADPSDSTTWKNDVSLVFEKCDILNVFTIKDGVKEAAIGVELDFVNDDDTKGFVIDWRQYYDGSNNLIAGCYQVFIECEIEGISFERYHSVVNLLPYTTQTSEGTVRINSIFNDYSDALGINFTGSGAQDTVRFRGFFGKRQPNMTIENITLTDREVNKVYNEARPTYSLICDPTTYCTTYWVEQIHLLHANVMYISDYNAYNHTEFKEFPVILNDEEGPEYDYFDGTGTNKAKIVASFKEKIANKKSKYETDLKGSSIPDIGLWQGVVCDGTAEVDINNTNYYTVAAGTTQNINALDLNGDILTVVSQVGDDVTFNAVATNTALTWKVRTFNTGTSNDDQFTIPTRPGESYNYDVETSDGQTFTGQTGDLTITFPYEGVFTIKISETFDTPYFNAGGDKDKLIEISNWGNIVYGSNISVAYRDCQNCEITANDLPDLSNVTTMQDTFRNMDILTWSPIVSQLFDNATMLSSARFTFFACLNFNQDLNDLDVSNITNLERFLSFSSSYDHYLGDWQLNSGLTSMAQIFRNTGMSTANYTDTLVGWANYVFDNGGSPSGVDMSTQTGMIFDTARSGGANFPDAGAARTYLTTTASWTISGDTVI